MKEHVQKTGVRKYAGDDLIELQSEPLKALQSFFAEYGNCIVRGCEVSPAGDNLYNVAPGIIAVKGKDCEGAGTFKVVPFAGVEGVTLPLYLTLTYTVSERVYGDGKVKPIAYNYTAAATNIQPEEVPFLEITAAGGRRFVDAIRLTEKLDKTGNGRDVTVTFGEAAERVNVTSGEKLSGLWGKVQKWFAGLKAVAFTGKAADLEQDGMHRLVTDQEKAGWADKYTKALTYTRAEVEQKIADVVNSAPGTLDTLQELAAALGNDPNFATSIMALVGGKADTIHTHTKSQITDFPTSLPANGGLSGRSLATGRTSIEFCPTNTYMSSPVDTGIRLILPYMANSNLMLSFTVRSYKSYQAHDIQFSGYLFPDSNQWYIPQAVMIAGTAAVPIRMGKMDDGRAYVWIGNTSHYFGIAVLNVVGGYIGVDLSGGWEIGTTDETPNLALEKILYPNATTNQIPTSVAKLTYLSDVWGLPSDIDGASGGWIRTPGNGLLPFQVNAVDGASSVGNADWPFRTMYAKTFHGNLDGTASNADKLSGFTPMDLIPEDKSASIMAANTAMNMHGFGYSRNGWGTSGSFISFGGVGNKYHTQLQGSYESDNLYFRTHNSDVDQLSFHPWKKVAVTEDLELLNNQLNLKADKNHNHDSVYATKSQLNLKADKNHNHDDAYAAKNHTHSGVATMKAMYEFVVKGSKIDKDLKKGSDIVTEAVRYDGGKYTIKHNLGHDNYVVILGTGRREGTDLIVKAGLIEQNAAYFRVQTSWGDQFHDGGFYATILTF